MGESRRSRARRIEPAAGLDVGDGRAPDYASSFAADVADADTRSAEEWARAVLEGAPLPLRWFVLIGWRLVLRLRLAPRGPGAVAGWTIGGATPETITLDVASGSMTARKVLTVDQGRVTLTTYVWFERRRGRLIWSALAPVHHRIEPLLVSLGTSRPR